MSNSWNNAPHHEELLSVGSHKMFLSVQGPPRTSAKDPVVITEPGLGCSGAWWSAVQRELSPYLRVFSYDRSGLGRSEKSPHIRSAENCAAELQRLLNAANVEPPYIVIAHSYGGIISREFVELLCKDGAHGSVVGVILVDTNQEKSLAQLDVPFAAMGPMMAGVNGLEASGLGSEHKFTPDEFAALMKIESSAEGSASAPEEKESMASSCTVLASKNQFERQVLSPYPVVVIRGNNLREVERVEAAALALGNGTEDQRREIQLFKERIAKYDKPLQKEQLKLSNTSRFVQIEDCGHHPHVTNPSEIAEEVLQVYESAGQ